jgi:hypothetical protein
MVGASIDRTPSKKAKNAMNAATRVQGGLDTRSSSPGRKTKLTFNETATAVKHAVPAFASSCAALHPMHRGRVKASASHDIVLVQISK